MIPLKPCRRSLRKLTAIFLSVSLTLCNSLSYAAPVLSIPQTLITSPQISIPEEIGKIEESFQGTADKTIVYIQDAHDSLEAQENIAKIIHYLVERYGVNTVYEEGYEGPVPTDKYFGFIKDRTVREKVSYFLMDRLRIGGAEYAHINRTNDFNLIGADSFEQHLRNIKQYRKTAQHQEEIKKDLSALQNEIFKLANQYFPASIKDWMRIKERLDNNQLELLDYMKRLKTLLVQRIALPEFQTRYSNITLFLSAQNSSNQGEAEKTKRIDPKFLFIEIGKMENGYADLMLKRKRDRQIFTYYKNLQLLKRLAEIELTTKEYEAVKEILQNFKTEELAQFIALTTKKDIVLSKYWERHISGALNFYELAKSRDSAIAGRLEEFLKKRGENISVLVFGGFHKDDIKTLFEQKHLSYQILMPRITSISEKHQAYYKRLMSVGSYPFEVPLNLARASRNMTTFNQARIDGEMPVYAELGIINSIVETNRDLETPSLHLKIQTGLEKPDSRPKPSSVKAESFRKSRSNPEQKNIITSPLQGARQNFALRLVSKIAFAGVLQAAAESVVTFQRARSEVRAQAPYYRTDDLYDRIERIKTQIQQEPNKATESELHSLLEILIYQIEFAHEQRIIAHVQERYFYEVIRKGAETLDLFLQLNPNAFSPKNLDYVLRKIKKGMDRYSHSFSGIFAAMSIFFKANNQYANASNLKALLKIVSKKDSYRRRETIAEVEQTLQVLIGIAPEAFTEKNFDFFLREIFRERFYLSEEKELHLKVIDYFKQANPAAFNASNFKFAFKKLHIPWWRVLIRRITWDWWRYQKSKREFWSNRYIQQDRRLRESGPTPYKYWIADEDRQRKGAQYEKALDVLAYFAQANSQYATPRSLEQLFRSFRYEPVQAATLKTIEAFIRANAELANQKNLNRVLAIVTVQPSLAEAAFTIIAAMLNQQPALATQENFGAIFSDFGSKNRDYKAAALIALPAFVKVSTDFASEINFGLISKNLALSKAIEAMPSFLKANPKLAREEVMQSLFQKDSADYSVPRTIRQVRIIGHFVAANPALATTENFRRIIDNITHVKREAGSYTHYEQRYAMHDVQEAALTALSRFVEANHPEVFSDDNFVYLLQNRHGMTEETLERILMAFRQANPRLYESPKNIAAIVGYLKDGKNFIQQMIQAEFDAADNGQKQEVLAKWLERLLMTLHATTSTSDKGRAHLVELIFKFIGSLNGTPIEELVSNEVNKSGLQLFYRISREIAEEPEATRITLEQQFIKSLTGYINQIWKPIDEERVKQEYDAMSSFLSVTHSNLPLILDSVSRLGTPIRHYQQLPKVLNFNNALTRIMRMLGEPKSIVGGHLETVRKIINARQDAHFYKLILHIAEKRKRLAPQEVAGVLDLLAEMNFQNWTEADWQRFSERVDKYHQAGFKVLNLELFNYFIQHENDDEAIQEFKADVDRELGNIVWGNFSGLSEEFKRKYNISDAGELALVARYVPIANLATHDYVGMYGKIRKVLKSRENNWKDEVDPSVRTLYAMRGTEGYMEYEPPLNDPEAATKRQTLHSNLQSYAETPEHNLEAIVDLMATPEEYAKITSTERKQAIVQYVLSGEGRSVEDLKTIPTGDQELYDWLSRWASFLQDTWKVDYADKLRKMIREKIAPIRGEPFDALLKATRLDRFQFTRLKNPKDILPTLAQLVKVLADGSLTDEEKTLRVSSLLRNKMANVSVEDLRNSSFMQDFLNRTRAKVLADLKAQDIEDASYPQILSAALDRAYQDILAAIGNQSDEDRKRLILADRLASELITIFSKDIEAIQKDLPRYKRHERESGTEYRIGFFDDLLHLMSFMMTGVCTWLERDRQVADTRYHFGKLGIKDATGRILGVSQAQLTKAHINGHAQKTSEKGWSVLTLPGINLSEGDIGMNKEKGVLALLETAQRLAEDAGMEGAVIPVDQSIYTNHPANEGKIIKDLLSRGWLREVTLSESVVLSQGPAPKYSYNRVYLVQIPKSQWILNLPMKEKPKSLDEMAEQLAAREKEAVIVQDFIQIEKQRGKEEPLADFVDKTLSAMPRKAVDLARMLAQENDVTVRIIQSPEYSESVVTKTEKEIALHLGKDIMYQNGDFEPILYKIKLAELLAAVITPDFNALKEASAFNENAYSKLALIQGLLLYRSRYELYHYLLNKPNWNLPSGNFLHLRNEEERKRVLAGHQKALREYTKGINSISQWNVFLNVMDNADPDFLVSNYLEILLRDKAVTDGTVFNLIRDLAQTPVQGQASIASLREIFKEFILDQDVSLNVGGQRVLIERFQHFDQTQTLEQIKETLITTPNQNEFYRNLMVLLRAILPEAKAKKESARLFEDNLFGKENRLEAIQQVLQEIFIRYLGKNTFDAFEEHLTGTRGFENIPYIKYSEHDLDVGDDADQYGFLDYVSQDGGINYDLVYREWTPEQDEEEQGGLLEEEGPREEKDWVHDLFKLPSRSEVRSAAPEEGWGNLPSKEGKIRTMASEDISKGFRTTLNGQAGYTKGVAFDRQRVLENYFRALRVRTSDGMRVVPQVLRVYLPNTQPDLYQSVAENKPVMRGNTRVGFDAAQATLRRGAAEGLFELVELNTYSDYRKMEDDLGVAPLDLLNALGEGYQALFVSVFGGQDLDHFLNPRLLNEEAQTKIGERAGIAVAASHKANLIIGDPHAGNLVADENTFEVLRIDLANVWYRDDFPASEGLSAQEVYDQNKNSELANLYQEIGSLSSIAGNAFLQAYRREIGLSAEGEAVRRSELRKGTPHLKIRSILENLTGRFTIFVDLADVAALTDEQFEQDYEKVALRQKNVSFVFYNAESEVDPERRERLEKLQAQLGLQRIEITNAPFAEILARQWFGKLIHVSKGKPGFDPNLLQATALRKDIYLFRYIENEIGVVATALLFVNEDVKGFEGKVIDLSMVSERLRSEVRQYLAGLVIGRAA